MNADLLSWVQAQSSASGPALSAAECAELFDLFETPGLPPGTMSAEMADGYLTAHAIGPAQAAPGEWLAAIFGQTHLPLCADTERQERLLQLLLRRFQHVQACTATTPNSADPQALFMPLQATVDEARRVSPYRCNAQGQREGDWELKDWAEGFRRAMLGGGHWQPLLGNKDAWPLVSPIVLFQCGYNPDKPELQIDQHPEMLPVLVRCVYEMRSWWQAYALARQHAQSQSAPARATSAKVGRNDPCPCGSGKKYKKCCGAL